MSRWRRKCVPSNYMFNPQSVWSQPLWPKQWIMVKSTLPLDVTNRVRLNPQVLPMANFAKPNHFCRKTLVYCLKLVYRPGPALHEHSFPLSVIPSVVEKASTSYFDVSVLYLILWAVSYSTEKVSFHLDRKNPQKTFGKHCKNQINNNNIKKKLKN